MNELINLVEKVILQLKEKIEVEANPQKLQLLLEKYEAARAELNETGRIDTVLTGGVRSYLDSYSDYMNNPLLDDMYVVEKMLKNQ